MIVKQAMNIALSFETSISKSPNFLCNFKEKRRRMNAVPKRINAKIHIEKPTLTKIFVNKYKIVIQMKSNIALVALATEYTLFSELFTFKKSIKKSTIHIPRTT
jgi:hypothetical protein